jgi:hypothetical protein
VIDPDDESQSQNEEKRQGWKENPPHISVVSRGLEFRQVAIRSTRTFQKPNTQQRECHIAREDDPNSHGHFVGRLLFVAIVVSGRCKQGISDFGRDPQEKTQDAHSRRSRNAGLFRSRFCRRFVHDEDVTFCFVEREGKGGG